MRRAGWWTLFVVLLLIVAFDLLVLVTVIVQAAQGQEVGGVGSAIFAIVLCLVVAAGLSVAARRVEHHVRRTHHPVGGRWGVPADAEPTPLRRPQGYSAYTAPRAPLRSAADIGGAVVPDWSATTTLPSSSAYSRSRRSTRYPRGGVRRYSPLSAAFAVFLLGLVVVGFTIATAVSFSEWRTSVYIQHHGVGSTLTVEQVIRVDHDSRSGDYHTVNLEGTLSPPVGNQFQTTAYTPTDGVYYPGETVAVLVDPHHPAHSELPGLADHSYEGFVALLIFTVVIYAFGIPMVSGGIRSTRRRRAAVREKRTAH
jgi:hypothetical protein